MTLRDQLKRDEGLRLTPYRDSVGKLTIGYGRNLSDKGITAEEAEMMLSGDIAESYSAVVRALPWAILLDDARLGVLVNMTFNMGIQGLLGFHHFLDSLRAKDFPAAARQMLESKWARQVGDRATRLSTQILTGEIQ